MQDPNTIGKAVNLSNSETAGKFLYECFMTLLIFWNCLEIPFRLAFFPPYPFDYFIVGAIIDWCFIVDVAVRFYLPYLSKSGYFITTRSQIRRHYLRTWFWVDAISSIPWDFMLLVVFMADPVLARSLTFFRYVRVTRMLRLVSIISRLREWEITINWNINLLWIRGARLGLSLVLWMNTAACIYGLIADQENLANSWVNDSPPEQVILDMEQPFYLYEAALYFAVITFTTIGYGDITPSTTAERAFTFVYIFCNIWILTITIGTVTSWLQQAERARTSLADKLDEVKKYCGFRGLPDDLSAEMMRFFLFKASVKGYEGTDFEALAGLTPSLRGEVAEYLRGTVLALWGLPRVCDRHFLTAMVLRLKRERRAQGEYLTLQGTTARKFFILTTGRAVLIKDSVEILDLSLSGSCFGELALFSDSLRRTATIRAASTCDLLSLSREDMVQLLEMFPAHATRISEYADRFQDTFESRNPDLFGSRKLRRSGGVTAASLRESDSDGTDLDFEEIGMSIQHLDLPDYTVEDISGAFFSINIKKRANATNKRDAGILSTLRRFRGSNGTVERRSQRANERKDSKDKKSRKKKQLRWSLEKMETTEQKETDPDIKELRTAFVKSSTGLRSTEPNLRASPSTVAEEDDDDDDDHPDADVDAVAVAGGGDDHDNDDEGVEMQEIKPSSQSSIAKAADSDPEKDDSRDDASLSENVLVPIPGAHDAVGPGIYTGSLDDDKSGLASHSWTESMRQDLQLVKLFEEAEEERIQTRLEEEQRDAQNVSHPSSDVEGEREESDGL